MKKLINKNVIKAMTLGISALMMANSMNLTAFASEGEENTQPIDGGVNNEEEKVQPTAVLDDVKEEANKVEEVVKEAIGVEAEEAEEEEEKTEETAEEGNEEDGAAEEGTEGTEGTEGDDITTVRELIDAAKELGLTKEAEVIENELDNAAVETVNSENNSENTEVSTENTEGSTENTEVSTENTEGSTENNEESNENTEGSTETTQEDNSNGKVDVFESIDDIQTALDLMGEQEKNIDDAVTDANDAANEADAAAKKANDLLGISVQEDGSISVSLLDVVSTASDAIDEAEQNIADAETVEDAQDAMEDAQTAADTADKTVSDTQEAFDAIEKDYNDAVNKYNTAKEDLSNALAEHAALRETAVADAKAAEDELQRLSEEVAKLKKAADQAAGYRLIKNIEDYMIESWDKDKGKNLTFVDDYRPLAKAIIETYYINDVLHGTLVGEIEWYVAPSGTYTFEDGTKSTNGDVLNYGYFKYLDENGEEHEKYVNYKTAKGNDTKTGRGIVIFEKTKHELADGTVEYRNDNWYTGDIILAQRDLPADEYIHDGKGQGHATTKNSEKVFYVDQSQNDTFRANLEAATKTIEEYKALSAQAEEAQSKVDNANARVKELEDSLSRLGKKVIYLEGNADFTAEDLMEYDIPNVNIKVVNALKAKLGTAKEALQTAQEQKQKIDEKLEKVAKDFEEKVKELTPSVEAETAKDTNETIGNKVADEFVTTTDDKTPAADTSNAAVTDGTASDADDAAPEVPAAPAAEKTAPAAPATEETAPATPVADDAAPTADEANADDAAPAAVADDAGAADEGAGAADGEADAVDGGAGAADALDGGVGAADALDAGADAGGAGAAVDDGAVVDGGAGVDGGAPVIGGGANLFVAPGAPAAVDGDGAADDGAVVDDGEAAVDDNGGADVITEEIGDQEAALAGTIPEDEKKIYDIVNDPTALAELIEEPGVHIGWYWWILIIAALGATGWALYRKYKKNKAAEVNGGKSTK